MREKPIENQPTSQSALDDAVAPGLSQTKQRSLGVPSGNRSGSRPRRRNQTAFTLIELLVVFAIISLLAGILLPVFSRACARAHQTACLSNERQLGIALIQYTQDNDERFPNGINQTAAAGAVWPAEGWAGQCLPYIKSTGVLVCPEDPTQASPPNDFPVSYAISSNVVAYRTATSGIPAGLLYNDLSSPARSILLFEVSGVTANIARTDEGSANDSLHGSNFSAAGNGLDNRLYAQRTFSTSTDNRYATGLIGSRSPFNSSATQFVPLLGRHFDAANYVLADGHARWIPGADLSSGKNAQAASCAQDNSPASSGCVGDPTAAAGTLYAAGTENSLYTATFSAK